MEEDADPGSTFCSSYTYSLEYSEYNETIHTETTYSSSHQSLQYPPSYMSPNYKPLEKGLEMGTNPETIIEKIEEEIDTKENSSSDNND
jgi:hypothetical protein